MRRGVEARVLEEVLVFGGEDGLAQGGGNFVVAQVRAPLAVLAFEAGERDRLHGIGVERAVVAQGGDGFDTVLLKQDAHGFGRVPGAGVDIDRICSIGIAGRRCVAGGP